MTSYNDAISAYEKDALVEAGHGTFDVIGRVLAPTYVTLSKNVHGKLGHATVCCALHRHCVQQHDGFINGMSPDGSGWHVLTWVLHDQVSQESLGWSDGAYGMTGAPIEGLANEQADPGRNHQDWSVLPALE